MKGKIMATSAELMPTLSQIGELLLSWYAYDLEVLSKGSTYYTGYFILYMPFYLLKWIWIFMPAFILVGGLRHAFGFRSRKNKAG